MKIKIGSSRIAILILGIAIKIPNFLSGHRLFLYGCYCNFSERLTYQNEKKHKSSLADLLSPSLFCSWFGLIQMQKRCLPITDEFFGANIYKSSFNEAFQDACGGDFKAANFGIYKGKIVCLDYP